MAKSRLRRTLSPAERARFAFLFQALEGAPSDKCPDLEMLLERLKAKRVQLEALTDPLIAQYASDSHRESQILDSHRDFLKDAERFEKACERLKRHGLFLDAPVLEVRPPAFFALLRALAQPVQEAKRNRQRVIELLTARASRASKTGNPRRPHRPLVNLPEGVGRDDARELFRVVRLAAKHSPMSGAWTVNYGGPAPCPQCGNPAPKLFRRN